MPCNYPFTTWKNWSLY